MNDDNDKRRRSRQLSLIDAIDKNDTATASSLISSGSVNLNGKPWPLHRAARHGRVEIMTMLLDAGADINAVDQSRHNACRIAILYNEFDALKLLVERGANVAHIDSRGDSLLSYAAYRAKSDKVVILLLEAGAPLVGLSNGELMMLVKSVAVFHRLVVRGVDFTVMRDGYHRTLCHLVARYVTCEDDLRFLVKVCGYDVHADGKTPLHSAASSCNDVAVRVLVEFGADIDRQDNERVDCVVVCCRERAIFMCSLSASNTLNSIAK
jgi:ankyrin repeat protein